MPTTNEPTVFIVDDDEMARDSVSALVESMGVHAETFASAEEFLELYVDRRPGCLVTDMRMSGMSGLDLQDKLRELGFTLPVVVITAYAETSLTVRAMQSGAFTLLEKPCEENELLAAIRKSLEQDAQGRDTHERREEIR